MQDLIAPHGGLREPVSRMVGPEEAGEFRKQAATLPRVPISDADLSTPIEELAKRPALRVGDLPAKR